MNRDFNIHITAATRKVAFDEGFLGVSGENLQGNIIVDFTDIFVDGEARLELRQGSTAFHTNMEKVGNKYILPILSSLLTIPGIAFMQIVISQEQQGEEVPVFKTDLFDVPVLEALNAEGEPPEEYPSWLDEANAKLDEMDDLMKEVQKKVDDGDFDGKDGEDGVGIDSIVPDGEVPGGNQYKVILTNGQFYEIVAPKGANGNDGVGIQSVAKTSTAGLVDTYTITFTNGQTTIFNVTNGANGANGRGIDRIEKTDTVGNIDTYTIYYTDNTTSTYEVVNGDTASVQAQIDNIWQVLKNQYDFAEEEISDITDTPQTLSSTINVGGVNFPISDGARVMLKEAKGRSLIQGANVNFPEYEDAAFYDDNGNHTGEIYFGSSYSLLAAKNAADAIRVNRNEEDDRYTAKYIKRVIGDNTSNYNWEKGLNLLYNNASILSKMEQLSGNKIVAIRNQKLSYMEVSNNMSIHSFKDSFFNFNDFCILGEYVFAIRRNAISDIVIFTEEYYEYGVSRIENTLYNNMMVETQSIKTDGQYIYLLGRVQYNTNDWIILKIDPETKSIVTSLSFTASVSPSMNYAPLYLKYDKYADLLYVHGGDMFGIADFVNQAVNTISLPISGRIIEGDVAIDDDAVYVCDKEGNLCVYDKDNSQFVDFGGGEYTIEMIDDVADVKQVSNIVINWPTLYVDGFKDENNTTYGIYMKINVQNMNIEKEYFQGHHTSGMMVTDNVVLIGVDSALYNDILKYRTTISDIMPSTQNIIATDFNENDEVDASVEGNFVYLDTQNSPDGRMFYEKDQETEEIISNELTYEDVTSIRKNNGTIRDDINYNGVGYDITLLVTYEKANI